ncbi:MAG: DNA translocase FtsK 4TM domain-containing protein [Pseudomonadota bacterium]
MVGLQGQEVDLTAQSVRRKTATKAPRKATGGVLPRPWVEGLRVGAVRGMGLFLILLAGAGLIALASFDARDPTLNQASGALARNWLATPGAVFADLALQTLGLAAVLVLLPLGVFGARLAGGGRFLAWRRLILALPLALILVAIMASAVPGLAAWPTAAGPGGAVGLLAYGWLKAGMSGLGLPLPWWSAVLAAGGLGLALYLYVLAIAPATWKSLGRRALRVLALIGRGLWRASVFLFSAPRRAMPPTPRAEPSLLAHQAADPAFAPLNEPPPAKPDKAVDVRLPPRPAASARAQAERQGRLDLGDSFVLPSLDLLARARVQERDPSLTREALEANARMLEGVLDDFGVKGQIINVRPGPVVTLYELEPAPGIKSARVIGLADDIARSMSAISARVAVVPGRNAIGIELPNARRETVYLRELLASQAFEKHGGQLPVVLGKTIGGEPVIADLSPMPHLLVAGTTGAGKSVGLNAMILSLLYRLPPAHCRFIMIDPKMLELSIYDGIPHLLAPVVTEPRKAVVALKWVVREMEERYRKMSKLSVRNITAFNDKVREAQRSGKPVRRRVHVGYDGESGEPVYEVQEFAFETLPLIVVVVDELADLMVVAGKEIEGAVQRLAQMARAAGIHLIMATQRPSVDVITGVIKANLPTRISFQVTSKIDSRTILENQGAEQLLGRGDMLYMQNGKRIIRVHGPFVSDEEVERVVAHLKTQGRPTYLEEVTQDPDGEEEGFGEGPAKTGDDLYDRAVALVAAERKASTSFVQRHLQIGYNRAARLIEQMERAGVVSPADHVGRREVLVDDHGQPV